MGQRRRLTNQKLRVAVIQVNAGSDPEKNRKRLRQLLQRALRSRPHLIALPETFAWRGPSRQLLASARDLTPLLLAEFKRFSKDKGVAVLLGSVMERIPGETKKVYNTSILYSEKGAVAARYRKIHLFNSALKDACVRESDDILHGKRLVTAVIFGVTVGLSVCYDLRFPELYRALSKKGAVLLFAPANFAYKTGVDHWEVLLRARAIENQCFMVAPGQAGVHPASKVKSFGTSMIIDPWGNVLSKAGGARDGVITADLDLRKQLKLRECFPVLKHRRML